MATAIKQAQKAVCLKEHLINNMIKKSDKLSNMVKQA